MQKVLNAPDRPGQETVLLPAVAPIVGRAAGEASRRHPGALVRRRGPPGHEHGGVRRDRGRAVCGISSAGVA